MVHGVATPHCAKLLTMIHEIEQGRRPMTDDNLVELMHEPP